MVILHGKVVTSSSLTRGWNYAYHPTTLLKSVTGPRFDVAQVTSYAYDGHGDVAAVTDALGHVTEITSYDPDGRPLKIVDANGRVMKLSYDPRGRLIAQAAGTENTIYGYDEAAI